MRNRRRRRRSIDPPVPGPEDAAMDATAPAVGFRALARSGLVLAGLLFLGVGLGDTIAGRTKIEQYEELLRTTMVPPSPADPAALFPTASEGQERHELAR